MESNHWIEVTMAALEGGKDQYEAVATADHIIERWRMRYPREDTNGA